MTPMKRTSKKKVELSWSNWILGGNLISIVEGKQTDTRMDVKEVKHRRKAFVKNADGSYSTIDLPEDFEYSSYRHQSPRRRSRRTSGVDIGVNSQVDVDIQEDTDDEAKGGDTTDEETDNKSTEKDVKHDRNAHHRDLTGKSYEGMKWCAICKVPEPDGTEDTMPEGAMKAYCAQCDTEHWVRQNNNKKQWEAKEAELWARAEQLVNEDEKKHKKGDSSKNKGKKGDKETVKDVSSEPEPETETETEIHTTDDEGVITWTAEQDKTILEMKAASGNSWATIATAIGVDDRDAVKERYKELQKNLPKTEHSKKSGKANKATEEKTTIDETFGMDLFGELNAEEADVLAGLNDLLKASNLDVDTTDNEEHNKKAEGKQAKQNKGDNNKGGDGGNKKKGGKNNNGGGKNNTQSPKASADEPTKASNPPTNSPDSSPKCEPKPTTHKTVAQKTRDPDNGQFHFGPRFYGKLRPDAVWSKDDCDLLEHLLERYDNEKWLHMQANFYNWTGRMIAAEFIERKFKADYGPSAFDDED